MEWFTNLFNFDRIGRKIKTFYKWLCWISIGVVSVLLAISFLLCLFSGEIEMLGITVLLIVIEPLVIYIGCWFPYAFGELVDNSTMATQRNSLPVEPEDISPDPTQSGMQEHIVKQLVVDEQGQLLCKNCWKKVPKDHKFCTFCGAKL